MEVNNNPQIRVTTSFVNFDARIMDQWSNGGGARWVIGNDSYHPFQGRSFGGADRGAIRGTQAYGSGYAYGDDDHSTVAGRGFPFGTWPIYWGENFMGSDEYGPQLDTARPGGQIVTIPIKPQPSWQDTRANETYYAIGDRDSIMGIMVSLVTWCSAEPAWPSKFNPTSPNSTVRIENVIQYYRASSFALASPDYNNTLARSSATNSTESTPLPQWMADSPFRECLDGVVANALMIMNQPPKKGTTLAMTLRIVFGILGFPIIALFAWAIVGIWKCHKNARQNALQRKSRRQEAINKRKAALMYEEYP